MLLKRIDVDGDGSRYLFWCVACGRPHSFAVGSEKGPHFHFNGDMECPSFNPSMLTKRIADPSHRCHCHVGQGVIRYLKECTHRYANKDEPMVDMPANV